MNLALSSGILFRGLVTKRLVCLCVLIGATFFMILLDQEHLDYKGKCKNKCVIYLFCCHLYLLDGLGRGLSQWSEVENEVCWRIGRTKSLRNAICKTYFFYFRQESHFFRFKESVFLEKLFSKFFEVRLTGTTQNTLSQLFEKGYVIPSGFTSCGNKTSDVSIFNCLTCLQISILLNVNPAAFTFFLISERNIREV